LPAERHTAKPDGLRKEKISWHDLSTNFIGIQINPQPFLAPLSAPPTDKAYNVERAFAAGWAVLSGRRVGKRGLRSCNVNGPGYGAIWGPDPQALWASNTFELITDRDLEVNRAESLKSKEPLARPAK